MASCSSYGHLLEDQYTLTAGIKLCSDAVYGKCSYCISCCVGCSFSLRNTLRSKVSLVQTPRIRRSTLILGLGMRGLRHPQIFCEGTAVSEAVLGFLLLLSSVQLYLKQ